MSLDGNPNVGGNSLAQDSSKESKLRVDQNEEKSGYSKSNSKHDTLLSQKKDENEIEESENSNDEDSKNEKKKRKHHHHHHHSKKIKKSKKEKKVKKGGNSKNSTPMQSRSGLDMMRTLKRSPKGGSNRSEASRSPISSSNSSSEDDQLIYSGPKFKYKQHFDLGGEPKWKHEKFTEQHRKHHEHGHREHSHSSRSLSPSVKQQDTIRKRKHSPA